MVKNVLAKQGQANFNAKHEQQLAQIWRNSDQLRPDPVSQTLMKHIKSIYENTLSENGPIVPVTTCGNYPPRITESKINKNTS